MRKWNFYSGLAVALVGVGLGGIWKAGAAELTGEPKQWHRVTLTFDGPEASERGEPNPFLDYRLTVTFRHGDLKYRVPGFFAGDGEGGGAGSQWRVRFAPGATGKWHYEADLRKGNNIAVKLAPKAGKRVMPKAEGSFTVRASDKEGDDFRAPGHGRLVNFGSHYLQFAGSGERWIKGGPDIPENFLGYTGFDNTPDAGHDFDAHREDWERGDPDWNDGAGRGIVGALNYIAEQGGNSIYFLPMNLGGDAKDTFPTIGPDAKTRYDISKLAQWETVFTHADSLGIFLHFQLAETESGNENYHDGGNLGVERKLFYRELIARFGHHLGLEWDIGEENDYGAEKRKAFARYLKRVDPYDHPVTTHTHTGQFEEFYGPLLGNDNFDMTAFQSSEGDLDEGDAIIEWRERSAKARVPWVVSLDEPQKIENDLDDEENGYVHGRKHFLWPVYLSGGGGFEWYVQRDGGGHSLDQHLDDFQALKPALNWTAHARSFMYRLPFWEMQPDKALATSSAETPTYVLAKPGSVYALYNENGGELSLDLTGTAGTYTVAWFNPREGGDLLKGKVTEIQGGDERSLGRAPQGPNRDWAVIVRRRK